MWNSRSYFAGGQDKDNDDQPYGYGGGQQYEATGGKKQRGSSRLKKSSGGKKDADADHAAEDDYPKYAGNNNNNEADDNRYNRPNGNYNGGTAIGAPYYGATAGGGYGNSSPYGGGGGGYGNSSPYGGYGNGAPYGTGGGGDGGYAPYSNVPPVFLAPQDGTRSPLYINTRAVHVYGAGGYDKDDNNDDDHRRRRSGGFFGPAFHAVGHFFDRKFGFNDRD